MGWEFEHPYSFNIGGVEYEETEHDDDIEDAHAVSLSDVLPAQNHRPRFSYVQGFADEWVYELIVEERLSPVQEVAYPQCLAGERACPPENCGGHWGYGNMLKALKDPAHPEHNNWLEWVGADFDPERFNLEAVNKELRRLRM